MHQGNATSKKTNYLDPCFCVCANVIRWRRAELKKKYLSCVYAWVKPFSWGSRTYDSFSVRHLQSRAFRLLIDRYLVNLCCLIFLDFLVNLGDNVSGK